MPTTTAADNPGGEVNSRLSTEQSELPACASCRKKKLRCSRDTPRCGQCRRSGTQCTYDPKQKPGMRSGAIEALNKRLAVLESLLLDNDETARNRIPADDEAVLNADIASHSNRTSMVQGQDRSSNPPEASSAKDATDNSKELSSKPATCSKRKLAEFLDQPCASHAFTHSIGDYLPSKLVLAKLVDYFCISFHHWIPFLHKGRLQTRVRQDVFSWSDHLLFHAIVTVTIRHASRISLDIDETEIASQHQLSHTIVTNHAIQHLSIESIQSLVLIVFEYLNDGFGEKAWPLIGLLTRAVGYLQLTVESSTSRPQSVMRPLLLKTPAKDWTQLEEERRLFWVVFMLDRFCSVYTGWNTSLTSEEVCRRLPADGGFFTREEPTITPYFGIWNKSAAKIGNSLVHVADRYSPNDQPQERDSRNVNNDQGRVEDSGLGAFAYCIEAIESMSQIATFFLQQKVDWSRQKDVAHWLTRFKELDLRLVHWKMFLPLKWKQADISRDVNVVNVDPNLALAHTTHNVSMIMLHHSIAYPSPAWNISVALPSACSAEACLIAAIEVSHIVRKFLTHTLIPFASGHLAFCAFIAAQALLKAHQAHSGTLLPEFENLVTDIWTMSQQWTGVSNSSKPDFDELDQAGKYARTLELLLQNCHNDTNFEFDLINSTSQVFGSSGVSKASPWNRRTHQQSTNRTPKSSSRITSHEAGGDGLDASAENFQSRYGLFQQHSVAPQAAATAMSQQDSGTPNLRNTYDPLYMNRNILGSHSSPGSGSSLRDAAFHDEVLMSLSNTLMHPQFLERDRVITSEEANFWTEQESSWQV